MDDFGTLKQQLLVITQETSKLIDSLNSLTEANDDTFEEWQQILIGIENQVSEELIRVAVVGAIKSGKSTIVNSLFKGDYVKRGAGVVTSIVTRIRKGSGLKATLQFKSWDEINTELEQALVLFPTLNSNSEGLSIDIRRQRDRQSLEQGLASLASEQLITNDTRNVNSVLLFSYSKGYERVKDIIQPESVSREYNDKLFGNHREFVGDDSLAVYLRDIGLEIPGQNFAEGLEIADCQGSDSPNPLHLSMIQDYLTLTHLIIYVISSRTGLRQADIRFLSMIKRMGILDNIFFVVNVDFSEHESSRDLKDLVNKIKEELGFIIATPKLYILSGLYSLFTQTLDKLGPKDHARLKQWQTERELVDLSDGESRRFKTDFIDKITSQRSALMIDNHLERLRLLLDSLHLRIGLTIDMLTRDADGAKELGQKVAQYQGNLEQIRSMAKSTIDGAALAMKRELRNDVDRFFDHHSGNVIRRSVEFIRNHPIDLKQYRESIAAVGFTNTLYQVFQEYRQAIDTFMAQSINPEMIYFVREEEKKIVDHLTAAADPYSLMVEDALKEQSYHLGQTDPMEANQRSAKNHPINLESLKDLAGLTIPPARAAMRYSANIKADAIIRFGAYSVVGFVRRLFNRDRYLEGDSEIAALKDGVRRMRRETEKSILTNFKNYRENIKFQYILKLADAACTDLYRQLQERLRTYDADLSKLMQLAEKKQVDKAGLGEQLRSMKSVSIRINERLTGLRGSFDGFSS
jgi:GTPase SAR1 family protein